MKDTRALDLRRDDAAVSRTLTDYIALVKPRLNVLVVATSAAGYYLGATGPLNLAVMAAAVAGTAFVAGGASALNQLYERDTDALMRRTRMRPLPDGRIAPSDARLFGVTAALERGFIVGLQCGNMRARFMVMWVGEKGSSREGQVGLRASENGIWSVALPRASDDDYSAWLAENYLEAETAV